MIYMVNGILTVFHILPDWIVPILQIGIFLDTRRFVVILVADSALHILSETICYKIKTTHDNEFEDQKDLL